MFLFGTIVSSCGGSTGQTNAANANVAPSQSSAPEPEPVVEEVIEQGEVKTALPIVYQLPDGSTRVLPHLDLSLKRHVIGIWSGGMCVWLYNTGRRCIFRSILTPLKRPKKPKKSTAILSVAKTLF